MVFGALDLDVCHEQSFEVRMGLVSMAYRSISYRYALPRPLHFVKLSAGLSLADSVSVSLHLVRHSIV